LIGRDAVAYPQLAQREPAEGPHGRISGLSGVSEAEAVAIAVRAVLDHYNFDGLSLEAHTKALCHTSRGGTSADGGDRLAGVRSRGRRQMVLAHLPEQKAMVQEALYKTNGVLRLQVWFCYLGKPRLHVYDRSILIKHTNLDRGFENVSDLHGQVTPFVALSGSDEPGASRSRHCFALLLTLKKIAHCGRRFAAFNRPLEAFDSRLDRCPEWHVLPRTDQLLLQANGTWRTRKQLV
jgi:hypothetical protein